MKVFFTLVSFLLASFNLQAIEATHGMVIFGKEKLYAYHLPMFHKIHNKQMVLNFEVPKEIKNQILEFEDRQFLTFVPAPFDLDKFIAAPFDLKGDLYSGHFEKNGAMVMAGITLFHPKIVYLKDLVLPTNKNEQYKIFGTKTDTYALHLIDGGSALDQIVKLTTVNANDFDYAISYFYLSSNQFLQFQTIYSISKAPGRCPSRLCGEPGYLLASFKVHSLYFSDEVM